MSRQRGRGGEGPEIDIRLAPGQPELTWDNMPAEARGILLGLIGRHVKRLAAEGVPVWESPAEAAMVDP